MNLKTILVVDDEPDMVDILTFILAQEGYSVVSASDGQDALHKLDENACELVLTDIMMPRMDGVQLASAVRARVDQANLPIMALSALPEATLLALSKDFDVVVRKPFVVEELLGRVRTLLASS